MAHRLTFENSAELGVFARLTNSYCLLAQPPVEATTESQRFYAEFARVFGDDLPVVQVSIGGNRIVGRVCVGNRYGLLVPSITTDAEIAAISQGVPPNVRVHRVEERLSALGNCIVCNDSMALVHTDLDTETVKIVEDVLRVQVHRNAVGDQVLVGSYCTITNKGGIVPKGVDPEQIQELATILGVPFVAGTVNNGSPMVGTGIVANDSAVFCGKDTTQGEEACLRAIFRPAK
mmetsp:Transcript_52752/g.119971  ORF Transcript_52752/g.119971 Transcript_52752/m.119971 type:complete len:233 (-) Transcript_52752:152-850(-)